MAEHSAGGCRASSRSGPDNEINEMNDIAEEEGGRLPGPINADRPQPPKYLNAAECCDAVHPTSPDIETLSGEKGAGRGQSISLIKKCLSRLTGRHQKNNRLRRVLAAGAVGDEVCDKRLALSAIFSFTLDTNVTIGPVAIKIIPAGIKSGDSTGWGQGEGGFHFLKFISFPQKKQRVALEQTKELC
jgi:hypothetical protein